MTIWDLKPSRPAEQQSNGVIAHYFKFDDCEFVVKHGEIEGKPYTSVYVADYNAPIWWLNGSGLGTIYGDHLDPLIVVNLLKIFRDNYHGGFERGVAHSQREIRKALGIT